MTGDSDEADKKAFIEAQAGSMDNNAAIQLFLRTKHNVFFKLQQVLSRILEEQGEKELVVDKAGEKSPFAATLVEDAEVMKTLTPQNVDKYKNALKKAQKDAQDDFELAMEQNRQRVELRAAHTAALADLLKQEEAMNEERMLFQKLKEEANLAGKNPYSVYRKEKKAKMDKIKFDSDLRKSYREEQRAKKASLANFVQLITQATIEIPFDDRDFVKFKKEALLAAKKDIAEGTASETPNLVQQSVYKWVRKQKAVATSRKVADAKQDLMGMLEAEQEKEEKAEKEGTEVDAKEMEALTKKKQRQMKKLSDMLLAAEDDLDDEDEEHKGWNWDKNHPNVAFLKRKQLRCRKQTERDLQLLEYLLKEEEECKVAEEQEKKYKVKQAAFDLLMKEEQGPHNAAKVKAAKAEMAQSEELRKLLVSEHKERNATGTMLLMSLLNAE